MYPALEFLLRLLVQAAIIIPFTVFATEWWRRRQSKKSERLTRLMEGKWSSSFFLLSGEGWIDQEVTVTRKRFSSRLYVEAKGSDPKYDWSGFLETYDRIFVGGWENIADPTTVGSMSISLQHLYTTQSAIGGTTGDISDLSAVMRISTWVMTRDPTHLPDAKDRVLRVSKLDTESH